MRSIAIISFLLCLLTGVCLAQDLVLNRTTGTYVDSRGTPLSGNFRVEYGGQYVEEHQVVADYADFILRDGAPTKIMLYGEGKLIVEKSYAGRETFVKRYYPNGRLHSEVRLNGNVVDGESKYYRENGVLWQDLNLRGGMLEGREQYFRPDSSLQFDMIARSGAIVSGSCVAKNGSRRQLTQTEMKNWSLEQPICD